jgi:hypothetical protein
MIFTFALSLLLQQSTRLFFGSSNSNEISSFASFCEMKGATRSIQILVGAEVMIEFSCSKTEQDALISSYLQEVGVDMRKKDSQGMIEQPFHRDMITFSPPESTNSVLGQFPQQGMVYKAIKSFIAGSIWQSGYKVSSLSYFYRSYISKGKRYDGVVLDPTFVGAFGKNFPAAFINTNPD